MEDTVTPDEAMQRLVEGNKRFAAGNFVHPDQDPARRIELAEGQHPFAVILSCSDSRVPPEIIFDQGLGDLYVIRVAGHIPDENVLGSIEHAVENLGVQLVMVLGHKNCGAVTAAVQGGDGAGHIAGLIKAIRPAVEKVKRQPTALLENAIRANVQMAIAQIRVSQPLLASKVMGNALKVVGAYYDLSSGAVSILS
jgi:carbonic anhydrase